jgi:hypothetical protein
VTDSGRGIPQESLPLVFERMFQDPEAVDGNRAGLGLGLYIAKEIVTLHGGRMWVASKSGAGSTFSFTLPLYSLSKLLAPVIAEHGHLRKDIMLVRLDLTPLSKSLRGSWRETCQRCLDVLRQCVYVDKDVVLPPMGNGSPMETFFVVAGTDTERAKILMQRIRDQIGGLAQFKASGTLQVSAEGVPMPQADDARTLEQQIWGVADSVTEMIQRDLGRKLCKQQTVSEQENHNHAN